MAKKTLEQIDAAIARWQSRLKRSVNAIDRLQKQRKRIDKLETRKAITREIAAPLPPALLPPPQPKAEIDAGIPAFLKRTVTSDKDAAAAAEIRQAQEDRKKAKAAARASRKAADKSGATRQMPLTGKAALAAIRNA